MIILDASALYPLAKLSSTDPSSIAERLLREEAAVLDLTLYEAANAALIESRRGLVRDPAGLVAAVSKLASSIKIIRVDYRDVAEIVGLADELGLTVYDAAYVYYAKRYGAKLVTSDQEILGKAGDVAIETGEWLRRG